jgi:CopG family nickel-responsive transcriptional regulator
MTENVTRIGVSLEPDLLEAFDRLVDRVGYSSRSEALRDLVRGALVDERRQEDRDVIGSLMVLYDHDEIHGDEYVGLQHEVQHSEGISITANVHIHVDHNHCLEVIILQGRARAMVEFADRLRALKGIKHGELSMTAVPPA